MKPIMRAGIALAVVTAGEFIVFNHYNSLFNLKAQQAVTVAVDSRKATKQTVLSNIHLLNNRVAAVSSDGSAFAYIDPSNVLHVLDTASHKEIYHLQLSYQPVFIQWIRSDSLFIGTEVANGNLKDLRLSTISVGTGTVRLINDFSGFASTATFKQVSFSQYTNDVYILLGGQTASILYHYDTNSNLNTLDLGGRYVSNVAVTSTTNVLFFQDFALGTPNVLEYKNHQVSLIQRNSSVLRVLNNTFYYGSLNKNGLVTSVYKYENGTSTQVTTLAQPTATAQVFVNKNGEVVTLGSQSFTNESTHKTTTLPAGTTLINSGDALFALSANGTLSIYM